MIEDTGKSWNSAAGAEQKLVRNTETGEYYVVSGVTAYDTGTWEVLVFPADSSGKITDWGEVAGGRQISFEQAIEDLRRTVALQE